MAAVRDGHAAEVSGQGAAKEEDYAFAALDIITVALDGSVTKPHTLAYSSNQITQGLWKGRSAPRGDSEVSVKPNPWFVANGHADKLDKNDPASLAEARAQSPVTVKYLKSRAWKAAGGSLVSGVGGFIKYAGSHINVGSAVRHGSAATTSVVHLLKVRSIAASNRQTETVTRWCDVILRAKAAKASLRTLQTAGAVIPVPLAGTIANSIAAAAKLGLKITLPSVCYMTAIEIHWRAFQEVQIGGFGKGSKRVGPASRIFAEILTRRGVTAVLGSYDVGALIREPAGWMALGDKLSRD